MAELEDYNNQKSESLIHPIGRLFWNFIQKIGLILILAIFIRYFLIQPFIVDGASMEPSFHNQEYILVDKLTYRLTSPRRGDVIVFHPPSQQTDSFIKRIIGLPGETIEIQNSRIIVNGQPLNEPYLSYSDQLTELEDGLTTLERTLGSDQYFVMGDNRGHSKDSREIGAIPKENIIGRAWLILYPLDNLALITTPRYPTTNSSATPSVATLPQNSF